MQLAMLAVAKPSAIVYIYNINSRQDDLLCLALEGAAALQGFQSLRYSGVLRVITGCPIRGKTHTLGVAQPAPQTGESCICLLKWTAYVQLSVARSWTS